MAALAGGEGLSTDADRVPWARFQGRISYAATAPVATTPLTPGDGTGLQVQGMSLMGDVYFGGSRSLGRRLSRHQRPDLRLPHLARRHVGDGPGERPAQRRPAPVRRLGRPPSATRTDPANETSGTLPYIGIGYSSLAAAQRLELQRRPRPGLARPGNAVRLGRVFGGSQNLDDVVRDMRLTPVLQLGASYSF